MSQPNEKQKKPDETGSTKHDAQRDKTQPDESNKDQTKASDKTTTPGMLHMCMQILFTECQISLNVIWENLAVNIHVFYISVNNMSR